jgi:hypothetical protein
VNKPLFLRAVLLCAALLVLTPIGWAKTYHMTASTTVPGASAELNVGKEKNGNLQIELKVDHLAQPGRLTPSASTYVVWLQQEGSQAQSQGELKVGSDLKGELRTATPLRDFNVFVTAETDSQTKSPSDQVVLRATVQQ